MLFLSGGEGSGEELRAEIDNGSNSGFEFEIVPEDDVGFINSQVLAEFEAIQILTADEPSQGSDEEEGEERKERREGV